MGQVGKASSEASGPKSFPEFGPGDQIRVWTRIVERDRVRLAPFEGMVIRRRGGGLSETFSVRRITHGEGVERVFPMNAPVLERIELLQKARPPRARLYFLRSKVGKTRIASAQPGGPAKTGGTAERQKASSTSREAEPERSAKASTPAA